MCQVPFAVRASTAGLSIVLNGRSVAVTQPIWWTQWPSAQRLIALYMFLNMMPSL